MMAEYKNTPLELDNTMPKELYKVVEDKWHYCLQMEKEIRETTLDRVMLDLTKGQIKRQIRNIIVSFHKNTEHFASYKIRLRMQ